VRRRRAGSRRRRPLRRLAVRALAAVVLVSAGPVLCARFVDPPTSAYIIACRLSALAGGERLHVEREWVDLPRISPFAPLAVVAAEDQKFPEHHGFDFDQIGEALEEREDGRRVRGASTISQQVAKNLFLWNGRSFVRKGLEAWLTLWIELLWPKRRILEVYLNVAELGPGVFGVEAASRRAFGKTAADLVAGEAALLAAVLPNPLRYRAEAPSDYVRGRASQILGEMDRLGGPAYLGGVLGR
jgi:monofunctional biosynthetic peptidoglycan transglycosylase